MSSPYAARGSSQRGPNSIVPSPVLQGEPSMRKDESKLREQAALLLARDYFDSSSARPDQWPYFRDTSRAIMACVQTDGRVDFSALDPDTSQFVARMSVRSGWARVNALGNELNDGGIQELILSPLMSQCFLGSEPPQGASQINAGAATFRCLESVTLPIPSGASGLFDLRRFSNTQQIFIEPPQPGETDGNWGIICFKNQAVLANADSVEVSRHRVMQEGSDGKMEETQLMSAAQFARLQFEPQLPAQATFHGGAAHTSAASLFPMPPVKSPPRSPLVGAPGVGSTWDHAVSWENDGWDDMAPRHGDGSGEPPTWGEPPTPPDTGLLQRATHAHQTQRGLTHAWLQQYDIEPRAPHAAIRPPLTQEMVASAHRSFDHNTHRDPHKRIPFTLTSLSAPMFARVERQPFNQKALIDELALLQPILSRGSNRTRSNARTDATRIARALIEFVQPPRLQLSNLPQEVLQSLRGLSAEGWLALQAVKATPEWPFILAAELDSVLTEALLFGEAGGHHNPILAGLNELGHLQTLTLHMPEGIRGVHDASRVAPVSLRTLHVQCPLWTAGGWSLQVHANIDFVNFSPDGVLPTAINYMRDGVCEEQEHYKPRAGSMPVTFHT